MKKGLKISLIVLGSILGVLLAVLLLVSPIAKSYIQKHDKELIGRELTIGKLWINALAGTVKIGDVTLYEDDGTTPFVSFDRFEMHIKLRDLLHSRLWVKRALLSGLKVNIEQDRTWFNFNSMVEHFASDEPKEEKSESSGFGLVFNDINIEQSYIRYADLDIGSEFNLRDIAIRIPFVDLSNLKSHVGLDLCLADSATLHTDLHLSDNAEEYFINLKLNGLGIDIIEPYLQQTLAVDSLTGRLSIDVAAEGRTEHILNFDLNGDLSLTDLSLQDTLGHTLGHIDALLAKIGHFNLEQNTLSFNSLHLSGLNTSYIINADSTSNFDLFLGHTHHRDTTVFEKVIDTVVAQIEEVQEKKTLAIGINELRLDGINIVYQDYTIPDTFRYEISDLSLASENFTLSGNNAMRIEALLNRAGRLNVIWQGNLNGLDNHDLTLMLSNMKLSDFSPYVLQMFGYPIENGTLSFRSQNKIIDGNLTGLNKLQIASPVVGDKRKELHPQYGNIPLKLGLYLLTDKDNNVSIDLPISGNLNDPQFSYRKALLKVFGNLLVKVATSPFRLFSDNDDIQYIPFDLLQPDFTAEEYTMIDGMANTLYDQPNLSVILEERVNYEETVQQLCNMLLQRDFYLSQHPEIDSSSIDFLTNEEILSIRLNDRGLCAYAAQFSEKPSLSSKKEVAAVAYAVYQNKAERLMIKLMDRKNDLLSNYLQHIKGLTTEQISVTKMDEAPLRSYNKPSRYEVHVVTYEDQE